MPERFHANINPELLTWARKTAGYSLDEAAKKIGVPPERLGTFESGETQPTIRQLRAAAGAYKRPLAVFFLSEPPAAPEPLRDFRRLRGSSPRGPSPDLLLEIRRARRRRNLALQLLRELDQEPPRFPFRANRGADVEKLANQARVWLDVSLENQRSWRVPYETLAGWISAFEKRGVLVFQSSGIALEEMRGFSISELPLPAIVLNGGDAPRARVFTLMHEFTHLILMAGGLCDPLYVRRGQSPNELLEAFCNRVAGAILVPRDALAALPLVQRPRRTDEWAEAEIRDLAAQFNVSREVILFRLLAVRMTSDKFVSRKLDEYRAEYAALAAEERKEGGYPVYHRMVVRANGRFFTRLVLNSLEHQRVTLADVSDYLGVRLRHLDRIADEVEMPLPKP